MQIKTALCNAFHHSIFVNSEIQTDPAAARRERIKNDQRRKILEEVGHAMDRRCDNIPLETEGKQGKDGRYNPRIFTG